MTYFQINLNINYLHKTFNEITSIIKRHLKRLKIMDLTNLTYYLLITLIIEKLLRHGRNHVLEVY